MSKAREKSGTDAVSFQDLVGIQLSDTLLNMKSVIALEFQKMKLPISFEDWLLLLPLVEQDGITQKEYGLILGKDKTTISRLVSTLESKDLVSREPSETDRRAVLLHLTDKARKAHRQSSPVVKSLDKEFARGLNKTETQHLFTLLAKIRNEIALKQDEQMKSGSNKRR